MVRTGRDGVGLEDLAVVVLLQVGAGAVQHAGPAQAQRRRVLAVQALYGTTRPQSSAPVDRAVRLAGWVLTYLSTGLGAHELDRGVVHEGVEHADGIAAAANARHHLKPRSQPSSTGE